MVFAFNPDGGPARIFRYVEPGTLPSSDLLAIYDKTQNLLLIDREHFERLSDIERHLVLRTHRPFLEIRYEKNRPPAIAA
jgi:hypothetical protein